MEKYSEIPDAFHHRRGKASRRQLMIDAALDVIAKDGIRLVSHRRVAERCGVPLGSTTYYFSSIDDLIYEAFSVFVRRSVDDYYRQFAGVQTLEQARESVTRILTHSTYMDRRNIRLGAELYSLGTRDQRYRELLLTWIHRSRDAMKLFFDEKTTMLLDAMVEGVSLHRSLERDKHPSELIHQAVVQLTPPESFIYVPR